MPHRNVIEHRKLTLDDPDDKMYVELLVEDYEDTGVELAISCEGTKLRFVMSPHEAITFFTKGIELATRKKEWDEETSALIRGDT